jgi:hypothetical protein
VICGIDNCGVIVEDLPPVAKRKKKEKRTIKKADMITNPEDLKALGERQIAKPVDT